jgi:hypothetical protein
MLFSEMLRFLKIISSKSKNIVKENQEYSICWNEFFKINLIIRRACVEMAKVVRYVK